MLGIISGPMRILVIGGTGFIGTHVVTEFSNLGHHVTVYHRGESEPRLPFGVEHVHSPHAARPVLEFSPELTALALDVVLGMHVMGERDARAIVRTFRSIARRLVLLSSGDVYRAYGVVSGSEPGPVEPVPLKEDSPPRQTLFPYRAVAPSREDWRHDYEKILAERVVSGDAALPATILRLPAVYGPEDQYHRFGAWVRRMAQGSPRILLSEREASWRWTHGYVEDVAHAIVLAATTERAKRKIYNVGERAAPTMIERARSLARVAGWAGEIVAVPAEDLPPEERRPGNFAQDILYDTSRIRADLDYEEGVPEEEGLRRTIAWERSVPSPLPPGEGQGEGET
jgi:nucleoside-diphosphate-sugar epimerase